MSPVGERCYPNSWRARALVWLLDRMPERVRHEVLDSYWSPSDVERVQQNAERLWQCFSQDTPERPRTATGA